MSTPAWIFGYGSLLWRPDIEYRQSVRARLPGYGRRFWQGSHDHRGTPEEPGRVVTLIEQPREECVGMAYLVEAEILAATFENLDYREKNGYERLDVRLHLDDRQTITAHTYIAPVNNFAYLGPASADEIAAQIHASHGPSGANRDYLLELAQALRESFHSMIRPENAWRVTNTPNGLRWESAEGIVSKQPAKSGWQRFRSWWLSLMPLASQL